MQKLNLPEYQFRLKKINEVHYIFDKLRKKYLVLTPEEWVRQNLIQFLIHDKGFPEGLIHSESGIRINTLNRRYDILIYSRKGEPLMLVECKAPDIKLNNKVFEQIIAYNSQVGAPFMLVSNGLMHFFLQKNSLGTFEFKQQLPVYEELL